ncbi:helix-turn-helix domain-containing protein [Vibrio harveyi]|uniref:helix-turn-helix domain-containing protein n=1 Tax=Vibrio harveyi TaxID=669 RepID=UPI0039093733
MRNNYGGRLGIILATYPNVSCPICQSRQVQIINYSSGDPEWRCRKHGCRQVFSMPYKEPKPLEQRKDIPNIVASMVIESRISLLKAWRKYRGLAQREVAESVGLTTSSISSLENKKTCDIVPDMRQKLALALNIKPEQLDEHHVSNNQSL